jgi:predicted AAA+ superfamily ATPase
VEIVRVYVEVYGFEPQVLLLDEIQSVEGWELVVRQIHDLKKYKMMITGSSSKLLSKEMAPQLMGRTLSYILLPFSFREFLKAKEIEVEKHMSKDEEAKLRALLTEYLEYGGFPDVVYGKDKLKILREYIDLILFRDFIERHNIKNFALARFMFNFYIQNYSSEVTLNSVFKRAKSMGLKISKDTVYDYTSKLEDTAYFFFIDRFSSKAHLRESLL